jgi:hypothetical protein
MPGISKRHWSYVADGIQCRGCGALSSDSLGVVIGMDPFTRFDTMKHWAACTSVQFPGGMEK